MEEMKQKVSSLENLYLAYERVIHNSFNTELILDVEKALFERDIIESLNEIKKDLEDNKGLTKSKFSIVMKIKDIEEKENINYRPLVIFKLKDHIYMQAIFNIVIDELKNFLPEENLGVVINTEDNSYLYENWIKSYSKFINRQKENLSSHSTYQYAFEYDITQFFPSINQEVLINDINAFIEDDWLKKKVKEVIEFYNENNLDEISKINYNE